MKQNIGSPIRLECTENEIDALLYSAIYKEFGRLANCRSKKERQKIRTFILSGYMALKEVRDCSNYVKNHNVTSFFKYYSK